MFMCALEIIGTGKIPLVYYKKGTIVPPPVFQVA